MQDYSKIKTKIQALKAIVARDGITPVYLGSILDDIADIISAAESAASQSAQLLVDSERADRKKADADLSSAISDERASRINGDDTLRGSISDEQSARILADGLLQHDIDSEVTARSKAVADLHDVADSIRSDLGSEASVRAGADNELRASIALLRSAIDRLEHDLDGSEDGSFAQSVNEDLREAYSKISSLADDLRSAVDSIDDNAADISHLTPLQLPSEEEHTRLVETGKIDPDQVYYTVEDT